MTIQSAPTAQPPKQGRWPLARIGILCGAVIVVVLTTLAAGLSGCRDKALDPSQKDVGVVPASKTAVPATTEPTAVSKNDRAETRSKAEMLMQANPGFEITEDDEARTFTFHYKKTHSSLTLSFDSFESDHYQLFSGVPKDLPSWLPVYPGASGAGGLSHSTASARGQQFTLTVADPIPKVLAFYKERLQANGLTVQADDRNLRFGRADVVGDSPDTTRHVTIAFMSYNEKTETHVDYEEKR
jgi:hypothetical protein